MPPSLPGGAEAAGEPQEPARDAERKDALLKRPEKCHLWTEVSVTAVFLQQVLLGMVHTVSTAVFREKSRFPDSPVRFSLNVTWGL